MDPALVSAVDTVLQGAGVIGAVALAFGWAVSKLYTRLQVIQDKRVEDAQKYAEGMAQATATIKELTAAVNRIADLYGKNR